MKLFFLIAILSINILGQVHLYTVPTKAVNNTIISLITDSTEVFLLDRSNPLYKDGDSAAEKFIVINPPANFIGKQPQGTMDRILSDTEASNILDSSVLFKYKRPVTANQQWEANQRVNIGDKRIYNGKTYTCRVNHITLQNYNPEATLIYLWTIQPTGYAWQVGVNYAVNDSVTYNGSSYRCLQAHVSQTNWNPVSTLNVLWGTYAPATSAWTVGVAYKVGDVVTYNGSTYQCLQAHTSISTWYPSAVPALWKKL